MDSLWHRQRRAAEVALISGTRNSLTDWSEEGGVKSELFLGVSSMAGGRWKPVLKKIWYAFLIIDLIAIIIVLVA